MLLKSVPSASAASTSSRIFCYSDSISTMRDNNLAIVLILILLTLVVAVAAYYARKWIQGFTRAMVQSKTADRQASEDEAEAHVV